jgi:hypothetical protein
MLTQGRGEPHFALLQSRDNRFLRVAVKHFLEPDEIGPCFIYPKAIKFEDGIWIGTGPYFCGIPVYMEVSCGGAERAGEWTSV